MKQFLCGVLFLAAGTASAATIVYDNGAPNTFSGIGILSSTQDDFTLMDDTKITGIGFYAVSFSGTPDQPFELTYEIFADEGGSPKWRNDDGSRNEELVLAGGRVLIESVSDVGAPGCCGLNSFLVEFDLLNPFHASAGTTYWLDLFDARSIDPDGLRIFWTTTDTVSGNAHIAGFPLGDEYEFAFFLRGDPAMVTPPAPIPLPAPIALLASGLLALVGVRRLRLKP